MAAHLAELDADADNREAWELFHRAFTRFTGDTFMVGIVFQRLTRRLSDEAYVELLARCQILYDALCPAPPEPQQES